MSIVGNATTLVITLPTWLWALLGLLLFLGIISLAGRFKGRY